MKLTDDSTMPFGRHKGRKFQDVPADYMLWLGDEIAGSNDPLTQFKTALLVYIAENRECLEKEAAGEL